jgi:adenylate cyclase
VDTASGVQIWSEGYKQDTKAADLIALQEKIARQVIGEIADQYGLIKRQLSGESRRKAPTEFKAYDAILRFYHYETELTPEAFKTALEALKQAVELDPEYGLAWAMLSHLHADNHALGFCKIEAPLDKALTLARKGLALAPKNQFVHDALSLVYFHRGEKEAFMRHVQQTLELNPNAPYIVGVAGWHMSLYGEWERGLALLDKGMKLNPCYPTWFHLATYMDYYRRGEYAQAFGEAIKFNYPAMFWDPVMRAAALSQMNNMAEAKEATGQLLKIEPDFAAKARTLIGNYVKLDDVVDLVIQGLEKAGLEKAGLEKAGLEISA